MTTDSGDPNDLSEWRDAEPDEEPIGRSHIAQQDSRPLEETTPLFGPGDQTPDPPDDPTRLPGHWDPVGLRWVNDEPTMKSAGILDDGRTGTRGESRPAADQESSVADLKADLGDEVAGPLRSGHWDPAALRWVPDEPTSSVGRVLGDESTQVPVEGGGAGGGVDPSVPFDPDTMPTSVDEGTAAAPFSVDSTSFEGSTAARGFDPSGPLDRADPNLQSLDSSLFDFSAPGPTLDPGLFDEAEPGPTLDPRLFDSNAPGPTLDPALFDLSSPGPTVDPALFDEHSPGPTLDPALLDHDAPGPTLDANRLDPSAPGDTLDKAQLERASERPNSVDEPADVKGRGDTDPRPTEEPAHPEPSTTPRHDDHDAPLDVG